MVHRVRALVAVASGKPFTEAAHEAGLKSGDGVGKLVKRFNARGLAALSIAAGVGRKPTYASEHHARILAEMQREPARRADQTATWELLTLRVALHQTDLLDIAAETIRGCAARGGLQLPAHAHVGAHGLVAARAHKRIGDDL